MERGRRRQSESRTSSEFAADDDVRFAVDDDGRFAVEMLAPRCA